MTSEDAGKDDTWGQTLITVTPEDEGTLREISSRVKLSSTSDTTLVLDADNIVYRRSFTHRQFIDPQEPEEEVAEQEAVEREEEEYVPKQDAENQTYLQGTPIIHISIEYQDEASQTMYMSSPCPPLKYYRDIMTSMNESLMPRLMMTNATITILIFVPDVAEDVIIEYLTKDVPELEIQEFQLELVNKEEAKMEAVQALYFVLARACWIVDPATQKEAETADKSVQTHIKFNYHTNTLTSDRETQTDLTCEPKKSNTTLLSDYCETKNMITSFLEDCLSRGLDTCVVVDEIMHEIIDKCAKRIRYPQKEQTTQTIASKLHGEKEEDVLRRLRVEMIVDPLEASIIVVPLMDTLLQDVCDAVSKNAPAAVKNVMCAVLRRTMTIIDKLMEIQKETIPKPLDQKLAERKKKVLESMMTKETETIYTQTSLAGIYEVKRRKESTNVICSVCRRPSICDWCIRDEGPTTPLQETKMLRTQDILLAYKPCYIVTKATEKQKDLKLACPPIKKVQPPSTLRTRTSKHSSGTSSETINICLQPERKIKLQESVNEWSYIRDATLMKSCSMNESISDTSQSKISSSQNSSIKSQLDTQTANALQILKATFCASTTSSLQNFNETYSSLIGKDSCGCFGSNNNALNEIHPQEIGCSPQVCKPYSKLHLPRTNNYDKNASQVLVKSRGDGFKIIPISMSQTSNSG